jgi:hypothetical protein
MSTRDLPRPPEPTLRCDHCGRPVRETQHTQSAYHVDYYTVFSGNGELCALPGEDRQHGGTYVRLRDRFDVVTCAECYRRAPVQDERDRRFHPERDADVEPERA